MTTEIYSCKEGQSLKEGKLDYSSSIDTKEQAEADAKRRCQRDPGIKKVAYYKVAPDGEFRIFYSYTNAAAAAKPGRPVRTAAAPVRKPRPAAKKPAKPPSFLTRLKRAFGL